MLSELVWQDQGHRNSSTRVREMGRKCIAFVFANFFGVGRLGQITLFAVTDSRTKSLVAPGRCDQLLWTRGRL